MDRAEPATGPQDASSGAPPAARAAEFTWERTVDDFLAAAHAAIDELDDLAQRDRVAS